MKPNSWDEDVFCRRRLVATTKRYQGVIESLPFSLLTDEALPQAGGSHSHGRRATSLGDDAEEKKEPID